MSLSDMDLGPALRLPRSRRPKSLAISVGIPLTSEIWASRRLTLLLRLDCQNDVSESITKLNPKSKLFVIREAPQTLFPKILKAWKISHLVFEKDTDAYGRDRDEVVKEIAKKLGVEVVTRCGRTLYDSDEVVKANKGKPTMSMSAIQSVCTVFYLKNSCNRVLTQSL